MKSSTVGRSRWLQSASLIESLAALVRIDSVNPGFGGPSGGESRIMEHSASILMAASLTPRLVQTRRGRPLLRTLLKGRRPGSPLVFETHVDTVSVTGMKIDPFGGQISQGRLWGRGSTDAKGQAVAMMHALAAWAEADEPPPRDVELVLVFDEEFGFTGAESLLADGLQAAGIVVGEPTRLRIVTTHKGTLRVWVGVQGKPAHGARPHLGINAISAAAALIRVIDEQYIPELKTRQDPLLGSPTINIARIQGGLQANLVPPSCRIEFDRRTLPGESAEHVKHELALMFEKARILFPEFRATIEEITLDAAPVRTSPDSSLVRAAQSALRAAGLSPDPVGVDYATDACVLSRTGFPIIVLGPGSIDQAHTENEFIEIDQLEAGANAYASLMGEPLPENDK